MEPQENRKIFVCLDVDTYSFAESTRGNSVGVIILLIFTIVYAYISINMVPVLMVILDTLKATKPIVICVAIYLLIVQKLIRVFIIKEKQRLEEFLENANNNITTLGDFYDIKASGYEPVEKPKMKYHKLLFKDGTEDYILKFLRGSITSEYTETKTNQVKVLCGFLNTLMSQKIIPRIIISDERIERSPAFKFYQSQLRDNDFDEEFVDLCNSTLLYHEYTAEMYSRITSTFFMIPAKTAKQKIFLEDYIPTVPSLVKNSAFRAVKILNKFDILTLFKDLNSLNSINELSLQAEEATSKVSLGDTKVILLKDLNTNEETPINELNDKLKLNISGIEYKLLKKTSTQENLDTKQDLLFNITEDKEYIDALPELTDNELPYNEVAIETQDSDSDLLENLISIEDSATKYSSTVQIISDGILDFKSVKDTKSSVEKSVILINNILNDDCDTIIL